MKRYVQQPFVLEITANTISGLLRLYPVYHNGTATSEGREDLGDILERLSAEQLRAFLTSEMHGNVKIQRRFLSRFGRLGTTSRAEFRAEIEAAYAQMGDAGHYGAELDFEDFLGAAKASAKRGDYDEALWMYQEISEAISDHMKDVDDSYAHYGTYHDISLEGMVDCIGRLEPRHKQKQPYISYMYNRIILDNYGLDSQYVDALAEMCADEPDRQYLRELRLRTDEKNIFFNAKTVLDRMCDSRGRIT